ncbi:cupin domain-containing protein [Lactococcus fujiensis]|uniref:cupin domain-containing protein n=1 Tax=Lactococcus fujiensis TaxID=610251 RepID=UPI000BDE8F23|nr:cupin domain-containing protein [Lactococcus fujiensis]
MTDNKDLQSLFGLGDKNDAFAKYFIGQSYLKHLVDPHDNIDFGVGVVTFEPRCRNNWHIHREGYQILLVTDGEGWYQEWGQAARKIKKGDVIVTHDGIKHWHGASSKHSMTHLALTAGKAEWLEPVSDDTYDKLDK